MPILYGISDIFYLLLLTVFPYRKKVILRNLDLCYPDMTKKEKRKFLRKNYFYLSNILAEGIKNLSISQRRLKKRMVIENVEILDKF
jgi:KDO2-lipid IV(A) lauroyltransferase